jgi:hypothetical protein
MRNVEKVRARQAELELQLEAVEREALGISRNAKEEKLEREEVPKLRERLNRLHVGLYG